MLGKKIPACPHIEKEAFRLLFFNLLHMFIRTKGDVNGPKYLLAINASSVVISHDLLEFAQRFELEI